MPQIVKDFQGQTVITTFETTPAMAFDLVEALEAAYRDCIRLQPGFIAAGLHMNDARTAEMRERNRKINELCRGFEPVMYEVVGVF